MSDDAGERQLKGDGRAVIGGRTKEDGMRKWEIEEVSAYGWA